MMRMEYFFCFAVCHRARLRKPLLQTKRFWTSFFVKGIYIYLSVLDVFATEPRILQTVCPYSFTSCLPQISVFVNLALICVRALITYDVNIMYLAER